MSLIGVVRWCSVCIASGCGSGYAKFVPGTFGSLAALAVWWMLCSLCLEGQWHALLLVALTSSIGYFSVVRCVEATEIDQDPGWIVVDEWAGMFLALAPVIPGEWVYVVCAFVLFRIFDATKLGPVGWAEKLPGAWGIMADDLVAGGLAAIVVTALRAVLHGE